MTPIGSESGDNVDEQSAGEVHRRSLLSRFRGFRPGPLHASVIVSCVVAVKSFAMSFAALHSLAIRNFVPPDLAANVPTAVDGLMVGSVIATAFFHRRSAGWWYAVALFVLSTLVSVAGNIEYAREIGGDGVAVAIHAGMPLTMMFAVHLTLLLWNNGKQEGREWVSGPEAAPAVAGAGPVGAGPAPAAAAAPPTVVGVAPTVVTAAPTIVEAETVQLVPVDPFLESVAGHLRNFEPAQRIATRHFEPGAADIQFPAGPRYQPRAGERV
ncbi:DUF2637 domain-containing protein [Nocardia sp. alder85J]|uniref:DUF2637 domain-containing protein n=1 Tax=Nocardia sp. alder85J TaxID=2862949 RepID=UPI001CD2CF6C|nr:DUF2637 domain-containing protein [Nocardia sp. alder85J]MCX4090841.1 DUF2637 domain-containing protein [Nocardia sp. alder85J]